MICRRADCDTPVLSWLYPEPWCSAECRSAEALRDVWTTALQPSYAPAPQLDRTRVAEVFGVPVAWLEPGASVEPAGVIDTLPVEAGDDGKTGGLTGVLGWWPGGWLGGWLRRRPRRNC
jgi:hypothetical protein